MITFGLVIVLIIAALFVAILGALAWPRLKAFFAVEKWQSQARTNRQGAKVLRFDPPAPMARAARRSKRRREEIAQTTAETQNRSAS